MPTKKPSKKPSKSTKSKKPSALASAIVEGLEAYAAHKRGEVRLRTRTYFVPSPIDVKALRQRLGLSQAEFSARFAFNPRTLQEWEQGRAKPDAAVLAYLNLIDKRPSIIEEVLR